MVLFHVVVVFLICLLTFIKDLGLLLSCKSYLDVTELQGEDSKMDFTKVCVYWRGLLVMSVISLAAVVLKLYRIKLSTL